MPRITTVNSRRPFLVLFVERDRPDWRVSAWKLACDRFANDADDLVFLRADSAALDHARISVFPESAAEVRSELVAEGVTLRRFHAVIVATDIPGPVTSGFRPDSPHQPPSIEDLIQNHFREVRLDVSPGIIEAALGRLSQFSATDRAGAIFLHRHWDDLTLPWHTFFLRHDRRGLHWPAHLPGSTAYEDLLTKAVTKKFDAPDSCHARFVEAEVTWSPGTFDWLDRLDTLIALRRAGLDDPDDAEKLARAVETLGEKPAIFGGEPGSAREESARLVAAAWLLKNHRSAGEAFIQATAQREVPAAEDGWVDPKGEFHSRSFGDAGEFPAGFLLRICSRVPKKAVESIVRRASKQRLVVSWDYDKTGGKPVPLPMPGTTSVWLRRANKATKVRMISGRIEPAGWSSRFRWNLGHLAAMERQMQGELTREEFVVFRRAIEPDDGAAVSTPPEKLVDAIRNQVERKPYEEASFGHFCRVISEKLAGVRKSWDKELYHLCEIDPVKGWNLKLTFKSLEAHSKRGVNAADELWGALLAHFSNGRTEARHGELEYLCALAKIVGYSDRHGTWFPPGNWKLNPKGSDVEQIVERFNEWLKNCRPPAEMRMTAAPSSITPA